MYSHVYDCVSSAPGSWEIHFPEAQMKAAIWLGEGVHCIRFDVFQFVLHVRVKKSIQAQRCCWFSPWYLVVGPNDWEISNTKMQKSHAFSASLQSATMKLWFQVICLVKSSDAKYTADADSCAVPSPQWHQVERESCHPPRTRVEHYEREYRSLYEVYRRAWRENEMKTIGTLQKGLNRK